MIPPQGAFLPVIFHLSQKGNFYLKLKLNVSFIEYGSSNTNLKVYRNVSVQSNFFHLVWEFKELFV